MTVVKYGSEAWALRKVDEDLLDVFQRNCLRTILCTWLTNHISTVGCTESVVQFQILGLMREKLRWLGHVLRMNDDRLPKIILFGQPSRAKQKADSPGLGRRIS